MLFLSSWLSLGVCCLVGRLSEEADSRVKDPSILAAAAQVWSLTASNDNPLWPGWDASSTPMLFYWTDAHELLVNHPHPPAGFVRHGEWSERWGLDVHVRSGPTFVRMDGQNTALEFAGVTTLVVDAAHNTDPYQEMAMIAHEAFHVYQHIHGREKHLNEHSVTRYPVLSPPNNAGFALEAVALRDALSCDDDDEFELHVLRWLAIRRARRSGLTTEAIAYEDGNEFSEGIAEYVGYRFLEEVEGREPVVGLGQRAGFRGFADLRDYREASLEAMSESMSGRLVVNGDPYGTAPARMRLYFSGMAQALILDRLGESWHAEIFHAHNTLTSLIEEWFQADASELEELWQEVKQRALYQELLQEKQRLQEEGHLDNQERVRAILESEGTRLVFDYSSLDGTDPRFGYTPFGVRVIDAERVLYSMVPISLQLPDGSTLVQTALAPLLEDRGKRRVTFSLQSEVSRQQLTSMLAVSSLSEADGRSLSLELPGATIQVRCGTVRWLGGEVICTVLP